jgi:phosphate transport system substrate-binding protein
MTPKRKRRTLGTAALACAALALGAAGCGGGSTATGTGAPQGSSELVGAGSTLVAPLVARWTGAVAKTQNLSVTYGPIGSGGGIAQASSHTVDFGATDAPLTADQRASAKDLVQIPWALAATVVAVNVPGVTSPLKLTGPVVADIYLGKVTSWDDPAIRSLNPRVTLPKLRIAPVYRSDGSGDTFAFTDYLAHVSPAWRTTVGTSTEVSWKAGTGARGNAGVIAALEQTKGAIAYAGIAQVESAGVNYALLRNAAGRYPEPAPGSIAAAAKTAAFRPDHSVSIVDPPASAPTAYPLATFTYVLVPRGSSKLAALKRFVRYAIDGGQSFAAQLSFAPLPASVRAVDLKAVNGL